MSIKIENIDVYGFEASIRGMRSPMNSWDMSDSAYADPNCEDCPCSDESEFQFGVCKNTSGRCYTSYAVGENDLKLMKSLSKAGNDHSKFLRMINVTVDITAPLYWWKEFDTYKVGTVANSCSTMHKIHAKEFTLDDFSFDERDTDVSHKLDLYVDEFGCYCSPEEILLTLCENLRCMYNTYKDKRYWRYRGKRRKGLEVGTGYY